MTSRCQNRPTEANGRKPKKESEDAKRLVTKALGGNGPSYWGFWKCVLRLPPSPPIHSSRFIRIVSHLRRDSFSQPILHARESRRRFRQHRLSPTVGTGTSTTRDRSRHRSHGCAPRHAVRRCAIVWRGGNRSLTLVSGCAVLAIASWRGSMTGIRTNCCRWRPFWTGP